MKKQEVLAVCNTPFQIIVVSCIKYHFFKQDHVDIIISDHFNDSEVIAENVCLSGVFRNVYTAETMDCNYFKGKFIEKKKRLQRYLDYFSHKKTLRSMYQGRVRYDVMLTFNTGRFERLLYEQLRRVNKKIDVRIFEEGITSYKNLNGRINESIERESRRKKIRIVCDILLNRKELYHDKEHKL